MLGLAMVQKPLTASTVVCTHFNLVGKLWATMKISNRLVDLARKVALMAQGVKYYDAKTKQNKETKKQLEIK